MCKRRFGQSATDTRLCICERKVKLNPCATRCQPWGPPCSRARQVDLSWELGARQGGFHSSHGSNITSVTLGGRSALEEHCPVCQQKAHWGSPSQALSCSGAVPCPWGWLSSSSVPCSCWLLLPCSENCTQKHQDGAAATCPVHLTRAEQSELESCRFHPAPTRTRLKG